MTEKSEFCEMHSFDLAIRRAYFKAQIRRNYVKNVVINRSTEMDLEVSYISRRYGFSRTYALMFLFAEQQTKLCTYLLSVKCCAITCLFTKIATNYQ